VTKAQDPHQTHAEPDVDEYQRPPRDHEQPIDGGHSPSGAGDPVDALLIGAQPSPKSEMSETKPQAATDPESTVSGKDELSDPTDPRATPPGETM